MNLLKKTSLLLYILLVFSACVRPYYVQVDSDKHGIEPVGEIKSPIIVEEERFRGNISSDSKSFLTIQTDQNSRIDLSEFLKKYAKRNNPKFIVYMNKSLSETVSIVDKEIRISLNDNTKSSNWLLQSVSTSGQPLTHFNGFVSKMEKGFISAFLDSKVKVLDRNYLLRMQELKLDTKEQRKSFSVLEMSALHEKANIFISVIPVFNQQSLEVAIRAIDLRDGRIILDTTEKIFDQSQLNISLTKNGYEITSTPMTLKEIVLTSNGYEIANKAAEIDLVLYSLAQKCMDKIGKNW